MPLFRKRSAVHLPLLGLIGFDIFFGQFLLLSHLPKLHPRELPTLVLAALAHGLVLFLAISALLGTLTTWTTKRISSWIWGFATVASSVFWLDSFGYQWFDLHFDETLSLLLWNLRGDFQVMKSKLFLAGVGVLFLLSLFAAAIVLYRATAERFRWGRYPVSLPVLCLGLVASVLGFIPLKALMKHQVTDVAQYQFDQAEWPLDLVAPTKTSLLTVENPEFLQLPSASLIEAQLRKLKDTQLNRRPNIFLFVVESLRADAISPDNAPNLFQLRRESLPILDGEANGNCTHIAWFSLFNSSSPLFWSLLAKSHDHSGAVPFRVLKALGYRVSMLATPSLHYYDADRALLSDDLSLAEVFVDQATLETEAAHAEPADLDRVIMDRLLSSIDPLTPNSGHFFSVFLDAPHHDYSWAHGFPPKYTPYLETVSLLKTQYDEGEITLLKNRYRNAVYFVDSLVGEFVKRLKEKNLWKDSIIVVVGDHGEEFMERGHLTHSSELNRFQTSITFVFYVPKALQRSAAPAEIKVASQVDVFPTLFDLLGVGAEIGPLLGGRSLVGPNPPRFAVSARCTSFSPKQIVIQDGKEKVLIDFDGIASTNLTHEIYARRLRVVDLLDNQDQSVATPQRSAEELTDQLQSEFGDAFHEILKNP